MMIFFNNNKLMQEFHKWINNTDKNNIIEYRK